MFARIWKAQDHLVVVVVLFSIFFSFQLSLNKPSQTQTFYLARSSFTRHEAASQMGKIRERQNNKISGRAAYYDNSWSVIDSLLIFSSGY